MSHEEETYMEKSGRDIQVAIDDNDARIYPLPICELAWCLGLIDGSHRS